MAKLKKNILVVDDDPASRSLLREMLQGDYEVIEAEDGELALELMDKKPVDLVITDRSMPASPGRA